MATGTEGDAHTELRGDAQDVDFFKLMERHLPRGFVWMMRHLPSDPRCRLCRAPYGGIGGRGMGRVGYRPARKKPPLRKTCFEKGPVGGGGEGVGGPVAGGRGLPSVA